MNEYGNEYRNDPPPQIVDVDDRAVSEAPLPPAAMARPWWRKKRHMLWYVPTLAFVLLMVFAVNSPAPAPVEPAAAVEEPEPEADPAPEVDPDPLGDVEVPEPEEEPEPEPVNEGDSCNAESGEPGPGEGLFERDIDGGLSCVAQPEEDAPAPEPAGFDKDDYEDLDAREFAKVARDPDGHIGRQLLVFGEVVQFDSFTGTDAFRASVDGDRQTGDFVIYEHNAFLMGTTEMLEDVVTDDRIRVYGTVMGALEYDTQIGGTTNAVMFTIDRIKVID
jgi:hypothetical protein